MNQSYFETLVVIEQPSEQDETRGAIDKASPGRHLEVIITMVMVIVFLASSLSWRTGRPPATLASTSDQAVVVVLHDAFNVNGQVAPSVHPSNRR